MNYFPSHSYISYLKMFSILRKCRVAFIVQHGFNLSAFTLEKSLAASHFKSMVVLSRKYNSKASIHPSMKEGSFSSRYYPLSAIELTENKVKELLSKTSPHTTEEWNGIKSELMNDLDLLSEFNFSSIIMNCLLHTDKLKEAHSFMEYLKKVKIEPNHLTYLKYMAICGKNFEQCEQETILQTFKKVKLSIEATPVLDKVRAEHLIQGICGTDKWFLALEYMKKIPESPSTKIKNCIAAAAIRNNDEILAWEVINKWFRPHEIPNHTVFKAFVLHSLKLQSAESKRSERFLLRFFHYLQQKGGILNEEVAQLIEKYFRGHSSNWSISHSKVNRSGECISCNRNLHMMDFSDEEFTYLRNAFLERSLKKSDLFINTTQREFNHYIKFIANQKPFHIVLDGLNVAHTVPSKNTKLLALQLLKVVDHFWAPSRKLLVLGRHHMSTWPKYIMDKISRRALLFLTSNISQDDPFMVYAALESGPHSYVVSLDLMRDHMSRLDDPKLIALFKRWQQTHQIYTFVDENKELKFIEPLKYSINIQGNMNDGWHIPFDDKIILDPYEELNNWLCIQKTV